MFIEQLSLTQSSPTTAPRPDPGGLGMVVPTLQT